MEKKIYVYGEDGSFLFETIETEGTIYPDSTEIEPPNDVDFRIYDLKFDRFLKQWHKEYRNDWLNAKAKELGIEIVQLSKMSEEQIKKGEVLPQEVEEIVAEENRELVRKPAKRVKSQKGVKDGIKNTANQ